MPVTLPPRRAPGDVIRSAEWNQIIDSLEDLDTRLTNLEGAVGVSVSGSLIGFATAGLVIPAGDARQVQPFSAAQGASAGLVLPAAITFKKLYAYILSNSLDDVAELIARHNETDVIAQITVPAGETGTFSTSINNYLVPEGDRVDIVIDTTAAGSGSIDVVSVTLFGVFTP